MISSTSVLQALEDEPSEIFTETEAAFRMPVMPYAIGKDLSFHLPFAKVAFLPALFQSHLPDVQLKQRLKHKGYF